MYVSGRLEAPAFVQEKVTELIESAYPFLRTSLRTRIPQFQRPVLHERCYLLQRLSLTALKNF